VFSGKIHANYEPQPSIVEQLHGRYNSRIGVAKPYVEPKRITACQIVNLTKQPIIIPARTALATIFPVQQLPSSNDRNQSPSSDNTLNYVKTTKGQVSHEQKLQTLKRFSICS